MNHIIFVYNSETADWMVMNTFTSISVAEKFLVDSMPKNSPWTVGTIPIQGDGYTKVRNTISHAVTNFITQAVTAVQAKAAQLQREAEKAAQDVLAVKAKAAQAEGEASSSKAAIQTAEAKAASTKAQARTATQRAGASMDKMKSLGKK